MKVTVYDANPGVGFNQWFLKTSWLVGCWLQKLFGAVDAYYGATSWENAIQWLALQPAPLSSIQYWGHGSPGCVYLAQKNIVPLGFYALRDSVTSKTVIWFRTCSTFQGARGQHFAMALADLLQCTVAGHTRIIGPLQGGLHTHVAAQSPSWPVSEGELPKSWLPSWIRGGNNTVTCLATKIPQGW